MVEGNGKCPLCGELIDVTPGLKTCVCQACGQRIMVSAAIAYRDSGVGTSEDSVALTDRSMPSTPIKNPAATAPKPIAYDDDPSEEPGCGATFGVFFLCWMAAGFCAAFTSLLIAKSLGFAAYSTGGLLTLFVGIASASAYRSSGKVAGPLGGAIIAGIAVGVLTVLIVMTITG